MRTIKIELFKFKELSEEAKEKALELNYDINVDPEWYEWLYHDAKEIGIKMRFFDQYFNIQEFEAIDDHYCIANNIITNHGEDTSTYKLAKDFIKEWDNLVYRHSDGINTEVVTEELHEDFDELADELESEFINDLKESYSDYLMEDYNYLTSNEAITETLISNEYDFTCDGKLY